MELSKIPMLNRFDTISHIMRYYASTHKAFLLLSSLCSDTRAKLDEYYNEFIWCMEGNWLYVDLNLDSNNFLIPFDLFKINISIINESNFNAFIQFIKQLKNPFGIQFQNHLFNSHIKINKSILINSSWIEKLNPYIDDLKSIQVFQSNNLSQLTSLDKAIAIYEVEDYANQNIPHFIDGDTNWPNQSFFLFKRIFWVNMSENLLDDNVQNLELIDKASVHVDWFLISDEKI